MSEMHTTTKQAVCTRCGGAGGHSKWPGFTCFRCGGSGIDPTLTVEQAEAKLERDAAKEAERLEAHKRSMEQAEKQREEWRLARRQRRLELNPELAEISDEEAKAVKDGLFNKLYFNTAERFRLSEKQLKVIMKESGRL